MDLSTDVPTIKTEPLTHEENIEENLHTENDTHYQDTPEECLPQCSESKNQTSGETCEKLTTMKGNQYVYNNIQQNIAEHQSLLQYPLSDQTTTILKRYLLNQTGDKPFPCSECSYSGSHIAALKQHMLSHSDEKPFSCSKCSYSSSRKGALKQHMLTHNKQKPFSCPNCSYSCVLRSTLKEHVLIHTGEKPFACSHCSYVSSRKQTLKKHVRTHYKAKSYACLNCSFSSSKKTLLKKHLVTHKKKKSFSCSNCCYSSSKRHTLKIHMLSHDKEKTLNSCSYSTTQKSIILKQALTHIDVIEIPIEQSQFSLQTPFQ